MALWDEVKSRFGTSYLISLTNPHNPAATTINDTIGTLAADDVEAEIETYSGVVFDLTDRRHLVVGVAAVLLKLMTQTGQFNNDALEKRILDKYESLGLVTGRNRIVPTTNSPVEPTPESVDGETVRPEMDWPLFNDFIPGVPGGSPFPDDPVA